MRLIWGRILASLAKDLPRRTFSKWHILEDTIRLVSASQGRQSSFQVFPSFFHALHSNGTRMANSCLHEADPLLFLKLKHSSGVLMENLITVLNSARSCKAQTPYWMLTIKHAAMPRFSLLFWHSWNWEKELQQDQCIFTDDTSRQHRIQTGALPMDMCKSLQPFPGYEIFGVMTRGQGAFALTQLSSSEALQSAPSWLTGQLWRHC